MAASVVHSTSSLQQTKPSIFEVIAQESLADDIIPAFRRVVKFLSTSNPTRYGWLYKWCDECYLVLNSFIQYNYLKYRSASFQETFYGLERLSVRAYSNSNLSQKQKLFSLVCLSVLPYLNSKWEKRVEKYNFEDPNPDDALFSMPKDFKDGFVKFYRLFHFVWRISALAKYLMYMTGKSNNYSLLHQFLKISLVYRQDTEQKTVRELWRCAWKDASKFPDNSAELLIRTFSFLMEIGAFYLQCLNWYHSNENQLKVNVNPIPKPPSFEDEDHRDSKLCPVCLKTRRAETALLTSGEVFCFKCIKSTIDNTGKCPVSGIPSTINDLIRIYHQ